MATDAWIDDVAELWRRPDQFVPTARMSINERLNALVRFIMYVTIAAYLWNRKTATLGTGIALAALITLLHPRGTFNPVVQVVQGARGPDGITAVAPVTVAAPAPKKCRRSTPENPFANFMLFDPPDAGPACPYDDHRDEIRANFNATLVRDVDDIYENRSSQRQYMTMPVTDNIPDTMAFAEFLAGPRAGRPSCKESAAECRGFFP